MEAGEVWRVAFEVCASLKLLRVFLSSGISPAERCRAVKAQLLVTRPLSVLCEWQTDAGQGQVLHVPLPWCLMEQSAPVSVSVRADHLEMKLKMLSVDVSLLTLLKEEVLGKDYETSSPLCLETDAEVLASEREVVLRCKRCSANLLKTPLRSFLELPSVDWQELSDQWYGGCCCEDKARSRSLVARCGGSLIPPAGTCLVGSSFCVVDASDVLGDAALKGITEFRERSLHNLDESEHVATSLSASGPGRGCETSCTTGTGDHTSVEHTDQCLGGDAGLDEKTLSIGHEVSCNDDLDDGDRHSHHCLTANLWADTPQPAWKRMNGLGEAMGGQSRSGWTRFLCRSCSSVVGAVSELKQHGNPLHELQLLKYHLSTDEAVGSTRDVFRHHSVQRVFANELLSRTEGDATYRFLVRDRQTKSPLLQLVVLNLDEWICIQTKDLQLETVEDSCERPLDGDRYSRHCWDISSYAWQPVMKIGYRNCDSLTENDLKIVEDWGHRQRADDMYMWTEDVKSLIVSLNHVRGHFPPSCQTFQQFMVSYLEK